MTLLQPARQLSLVVRPPGRKVDRRCDRIARSVTLAAASLVSCLVVYPLAHEAGHLLPAVWSGATVDRFVWTPLLGHPHVSLNQVSGTVRPWVDAGGILLPTGLGTLLVMVWLLLPTPAGHPAWRLWLLIPGGFLLLGNLGLFLEVWGPAGSYAHMAGLAQRLAGGGLGALTIELSPTLWSCLLIGCVIRRICQQRRRVEAPAPEQV